jgi:hypothetical protein
VRLEDGIGGECLELSMDNEIDDDNFRERRKSRLALDLHAVRRTIPSVKYRRIECTRDVDEVAYFNVYPPSPLSTGLIAVASQLFQNINQYFLNPSQIES